MSSDQQVQPQPLSAEREKWLREHHYLDTDGSCAECYEYTSAWPCDAARLLATLDAERARSERLTEVLRKTALEFGSAIEGPAMAACALCSYAWSHGTTEKHAEGCLAALDESEAGA